MNAKNESSLEKSSFDIESERLKQENDLYKMQQELNESSANNPNLPQVRLF